MLRTTGCRILTLMTGLATAAALPAADFSAYSDRELFGMQDQTLYMGREERDAYRDERRSRMQALSLEERTSLRGDGGLEGRRYRSGSDNGHGDRTRRRLRDGSGGGQGRRYGKGGGGRYRQ